MSMSVEVQRTRIKVWRPEGMPHLELRRGINVADPVPRHWHDEYQFCFIESGCGELLHRRRRQTTPAGSLFLISPGEVHANNAHDDSGCSYRTVFVAPALVRAATAESSIEREPIPALTSSIVQDPDSIGRFLRLHRSFEQTCSTLERESRLNGFLNQLISRYSSGGPSLMSPGRESVAVRKVRDYVEERYAENIRLEHLSELTGLSPSHLNRAFAAEVGMPPHAFQTQVRVTRAKLLLANGVSPAEAALSVGFVDQSHLTRHFKRLCVVTPAQYQQCFAKHTGKVMAVRPS
jgi:AraC-like DNA-binding protein